jgi:hypothetical protein
VRSRKGTMAAITAALVEYMAEEGKAVRGAVTERRPAVVSGAWSNSGREEMMRMRMLWQRRIVPR